MLAEVKHALPRQDFILMKFAGELSRDRGPPALYLKGREETQPEEDVQEGRQRGWADCTRELDHGVC